MKKIIKNIVKLCLLSSLVLLLASMTNALSPNVNQKGENIFNPINNNSDDYLQIINTSASPGDLGHLIPVYGQWSKEINWIWTSIYFEQTFGSEPTILEINNISLEGCVEEYAYDITWFVANDYWMNGWYVGLWLWYSENGSGAPGTGVPPGEGVLFNIDVNIKHTAPGCENPIFFDTTNTIIGWTYNESIPQEWINPDVINGTIDIVNLPPNNPSQPLGPTVGIIGQNYTFSTNSTDPEGQMIRYGWDWDGDYSIDEITDYYNSSETIYLNHSWDEEGTFGISVRAQDTSGNISGWSSAFNINITNSPPQKPVLPDGPIFLKIGQSGIYYASSNDPDGHKLQYRFDWNDDIYSEWTEPIESGQTISCKHSWISPDTYIIKVQARDEFNKTSSWSNGLPVTVTTDDYWPWWSMFRHDSLNLGSSPSDGPTTDNIVWNITIDGDVQSCSPVIVEDKIYVSVDATHPKLYCLDANNGDIIWSNDTSEFGRTPAVYDEKIFLGAGENIYCWNALTGEEIWAKSTNGGVYLSPLVSNNRLYFGSWYGEIYCLNISNGDIIWNNNVGYGVHFTMSSPSVADDKLFIGSTQDNNGKMYCFNASNGENLWIFSPDSDIKSSPAFAYGYVYFGADNGYVYCLNSDTGEKRWEVETTTGFYVRSSPSIANGYVYIGSADNYIYCIDALNGTIKWMYNKGTFVYSSPVFANGKIYVGHLTASDKNIICLNASDGIEIWNYTTSYGSWSSPAIAFGKLYIGGTGKIICFGANNPPEKPNPPHGPEHGDVGVEYTFSIEGIDPDGDKIYCKWDWDDGTTSGWFGPFNSGEEIYASHIWTKRKDYQVRVKFKDEYGLETNLSDPLFIHICGPQLEIGDIQGGLHIKTNIKNIGDLKASNITWNINLETRFPSKIRYYSNTISSIEPEELKQIFVDEWIFGLGRIWIEVSANSEYADTVKKQVTGLIFLFYVIII